MRSNASKVISRAGPYCSARAVHKNVNGVLFRIKSQSSVSVIVILTAM